MMKVKLAPHLKDATVIGNLVFRPNFEFDLFPEEITPEIEAAINRGLLAFIAEPEAPEVYSKAIGASTSEADVEAATREEHADIEKNTEANSEPQKGIHKTGDAVPVEVVAVASEVKENITVSKDLTSPEIKNDTLSLISTTPQVTPEANTVKSIEVVVVNPDIPKKRGRKPKT